MAAGALHLDVEQAEAGCHRSVRYGNSSQRKPGHQMGADHLIHPAVLLQIGDDLIRPFSDFLGDLEAQKHASRKLIRDFLQALSDSQQYGRMAVVTAGVHNSRILRRKGKSRLLRHKQGVTVSPDGNVLSFRPRIDNAHHVPVSHHRVKNPHFVQLFPDSAGSPFFLTGKLRMAVKFPSHAYYIIMVFFNQLLYVHFAPPICRFFFSQPVLLSSSFRTPR